MQFGLDVFSVHSDNTPIDSNRNVEDKVRFKRIDERRVVHGQHGGSCVAVVDNFDVRTIGPCGLVSWEIPDGHIVSGLVQVHLEEVNISPPVVVAGLKDDVVGVAGVHGLVPCAVPLHLVGIQETIALRIFDEEVANHG